MSSNSNFRILVVDDLRRFVGPDMIPVVYARDVQTAITLMKKPGVWDQVWLDHDLSGDETIRPLVFWMIENGPKIRQVYVQSMNPPGAQWVVDMLTPYYKVKRAMSSFLIVPDDGT